MVRWRNDLVKVIMVDIIEKDGIGGEVVWEVNIG